MVDGKVLNYAAAFLMFTCMLFFLIGTGAPNWISITGGSHAGLWKTCSKGSSCQTIDANCKVSGAAFLSDSKCSKLKATRAFSLISIFVSAAALACLLMVSVKGSGLSMPAVVLGGVLVLTSLIAWAAFTGVITPTLAPGFKETYDFSFGLFVAGWVFSIIATGLAFAGRGAATA